MATKRPLFWYTFNDVEKAAMTNPDQAAEETRLRAALGLRPDEPIPAAVLRREASLKRLRDWQPPPLPAHLEGKPGAEADWFAIQSGLRPLPTNPKTRRERATQFLRKLCLACCRAASVFVLCFAAATLALRLPLAQGQAPFLEAPIFAPGGTPGASKCVEVFP